MKLLKVLIVVTILLTLSWSLAFFWGKNQVRQDAPKVAWLTNQKRKWVVPCETKLAKAFAHYCDVRFTDAEFHISKDRLLKDVLREHPHDIYLLRFLDNVADSDLKVKETIPENQKILIASDVDIVIRSIRSLEPDLLFGSSKSDRLRLSVYGALHLEKTYATAYDFLISPLKDQGVDLLDTTMISEMRSRGVSAFFGPLQNRDEVDSAIRLGADGLLVEDASLIF